MRTRIAILTSALLAWSSSAAAQEQNTSPGVFPGDVIKLTIWQEQTLSGMLTVPPSGIVVFPKIGAQQVTGRTVEQMQQEITREFQKYLVNPSIHMEVLRKVQILGAVRNPSVYTLDGTVSLSDAIAHAGGVTSNGRQDRIELRRDGQVVQVLLQWKTPLADSPVRSGDQLFVPERSYFARNSGTFAALVSGGLGLLAVLLARS